MNESFEPLHQPPDPADLRRAPPANSRCARVRGLLRDFADGDLEPRLVDQVERHVHECRCCALALARAEHEVLWLRRVGAAEPVAEPPPGFAQRTVQRLLDELGAADLSGTDPGGADLAAGGLAAGDAAGDAAGAVFGVAGAGDRDGASVAAAVAGGAPERSRSRRAWSRALLLVVAAAILLATALVGVLANENERFEGSQRLVVVAADGAWGGTDSLRPLLTGDGLPGTASLLVESGGSAKVEWNDGRPQSQPAAAFTVRGDGRLRLVDGTVQLVSGSVEVDSRRPIGITVADGSRIELGEGRYHIDATEYRAFDQPLLDAPDSLRVRLEVLAGEQAAIHRHDLGAVRLAVGQVGIYSGWSDVAVATAVDPVAVRGGAGERSAATSAAADAPGLVGSVFERSGIGAASAEVVLTLELDGRPVTTPVLTGPDGTFQVLTSGPVFGDFAIVQALPPARRTDLGLTVPDAHRLLRTPRGARLMNALVLDHSPPVQGVVVGGDDRAVVGARVLPCLVDDLFGLLLPWMAGTVSTDANGEFTLRGLPTSLPSHQSLALLVLHSSHDPRLLRIPLPGSIASRSYRCRVVLQDLRSVLLVGLPPLQQVQLIQTVDDAPAGALARQFTVRANPQGRVDGLRVGTGAMWLRAGGHRQLRELVSEPGAPGQPPTFRVGPAQEERRVLRDLSSIAVGVALGDFLIASDYRHHRVQRALTGNRLLRAQDAASGRVVYGTQLFLCVAETNQCAPDLRFLGIYDGGAGVPCDADRNGLIVAVAPDGGVGALDCDAFGGDVVVTVPLAAVGSLSIDRSLRPAPTEPQQVLTIRLDRVSPVPGLPARVERFACAAEGWEVHGIVPGSYRVHVAGRTVLADVAAGAITQLR